jgi:hypothetical protein
MKPGTVDHWDGPSPAESTEMTLRPADAEAGLLTEPPARPRRTGRCERRAQA